MVILQKSDLGSGLQFLVADPGVRDRGPLPSPILTVQTSLYKLFEEWKNMFLFILNKPFLCVIYLKKDKCFRIMLWLVNSLLDLYNGHLHDCVLVLELKKK